MASTAYPPATFGASLASKASASDLLSSSRNGVFGVPLKALGRARLGSKKRDFVVSAKLRKVKKHDYPWPRGDPDPNIQGGLLRHLSPFKPLKEKPNPVKLHFEDLLQEVEERISEKISLVRGLENKTGADLSEKIDELEKQYQEVRYNFYKNLTPIQRVYIARHPNRPTFLDHVFNITEKFVELHGDRAGYDDPAIVTGLGTINGRTFMFIGHQKGRTTKENIKRNFGMPTPHGYRKALQKMYYADHYGFPIVTMIDTPGAYADLKSEELNQGEAIANNLMRMFGLKVPVISIVIGEGGSGGALAIACGNKLLMLENSVFYVASPEAAAAILYKSAKEAPKAAAKLKITAQELCELEIADGVIPEPVGGAHADPELMSQYIKTAILDSMDELDKLDIDGLLEHRRLKFRKVGQYKGTPVDRKEEESIVASQMTPVLKLKEEVEKLKEQTLKASESSPKIPQSSPEEMIEKLQRELDYEYEEAAKTLGFDEKFEMLKKEFAKARKSNDQSLLFHLAVELRRLKIEFSQKLSSAPNFENIKNKLDLIKEIPNSQNLLEKSNKAGELKQEIGKKFKEIVSRDDLKKKIEDLQATMQSSGDQGLKDDKHVQLKGEIFSELKSALESSGLHVESPSVLCTKEKVESVFNKEITRVLDNVVKSPDIKHKIESLKRKIAKAGKNPDKKTKAKIKALMGGLKERLAHKMNISELKEKLKSEILESITTSGGSNGNLPKGDAECDELKPDSSNVAVNLEDKVNPGRSNVAVNREASRTFF